MKSIILTLSLLLSHSALALNTSELGSPTEYSCIIEITNGSSGLLMPLIQVYQTCDDKKTELLDSSTDNMTLPMVQVKIIKALKSKGMHLVTQTADSEKVSMIFQKRDIQ